MTHVLTGGFVMPRTGESNAVTDVNGLQVGHVTAKEYASGVTVILCPDGAVAGVDVRGSAPGTRETDLLEPLNLVEKVDAVVLTGGSVYGLATADGVLRWLAAKGWGFPLEGEHVAPIVPSAALYDLGRGKDFVPPIGPEWGSRACESASAGTVDIGCVGAGTGAVAGGIKGGLGTASEILESGITVAAIVAVNSLGSVIDPDSGIPWETRIEVAGEFGETCRSAVTLPEPMVPSPSRNTTIGVVATDAELTKPQAQKMAQMAHDGLARAIRPAHTMFDGDTIFSLATGTRAMPDTPGFFAAPKAQALNEIGRAAADCFARAIIRGVLAAESLGEFKAFGDLPRR
jgi:L-aminopeptidase/D-esterase-like protein